MKHFILIGFLAFFSIGVFAMGHNDYHQPPVKKKKKSKSIISKDQTGQASSWPAEGYTGGAGGWNPLKKQIYELHRQIDRLKRQLARCQNNSLGPDQAHSVRDDLKQCWRRNENTVSMLRHYRGDNVGLLLPTDEEIYRTCIRDEINKKEGQLKEIFVNKGVPLNKIGCSARYGNYRSKKRTLSVECRHPTIPSKCVKRGAGFKFPHWSELNLAGSMATACSPGFKGGSISTGILPQPKDCSLKPLPLKRPNDGMGGFLPPGNPSSSSTGFR